MQLAVTLLGVLGLARAGLGGSEDVAGLRVVHLCQQLSASHLLAFSHEDALDCPHAGEAHGGGFGLFDDAYVFAGHRLGLVFLHYLRAHTDGCFRLFAGLLLAARDGQQQRCEPEGS